MSTNETPFYVLWNPESPEPPRVTMDTEYEAREVAEAMARRHDGKFYIMRVVACVELVPAPVRVTDY